LLVFFQNPRADAQRLSASRTQRFGPLLHRRRAGCVRLAEKRRNQAETSARVARV